jgi:uncharacterized protein (DUF305 family)
MNRARISTLVAAGVILLGTGGSVLIARSGDEKPAAAPSPAVSTTPVKVLVPGRPGETAQVTDSDKVRAPDGSTYNSIDAAFAQMMIVHHQQAIRMAGLAPGRAENRQLQALAERMAVAQKGEITVLRSWLQTRKLPETDPAHDHSTMPGMQTEAAIADLAAARGADFDRRFVAMMTAHHRGAQQMAGDVLRGGTDQSMSEMANEMAVEQVSEIRRMAELGVS